MNTEKEEYIGYLKSFDNVSLNEKISLYVQNIINYTELENFAVDNYFLSEYNYFKTFKIGSILKGNKRP